MQSILEAMPDRAKLFEGDASRFPIPEQLFRQVSRRLRTANYDGRFLLHEAVPKLGKFAQELLQYKRIALTKQSEEILNRLTEREAVYYLWALCLQAELYDYYGQPYRARQVLAGIGPELEKLMKDGRLGLSGSLFSKRLLRQELWTLVFWAHCDYRDEELQRSRSLLSKIPKLVQNKLVPIFAEQPSEPSYGLLARVAYSLGQVHRQLSDVPAARREFMHAIEFTQKRLEEKAKKYKKRRADVAREEAYAKYWIGKAFAFGLAWASYNSGELRRARMSAAGGRTLLDTTHDPIHRAYAKVIYAGILSSESRPVRAGETRPQELEEALSMLPELANDDTSPLRGVDRLMARAHFTFAQALHVAGQHDQATKQANIVLKAAKQGSRWYLECSVLLVQIHLEKGNFEEAQKQSAELKQLLETKSEKEDDAEDGKRSAERSRSIPKSCKVPGDVRIKVLFCHADVLLRIKTSDNKEIQKLLSETEPLARNSRLLMALHLLHQARCDLRGGMRGTARQKLEQWRRMAPTIEHGYVLDLADRVKQEMDEDEDQLIIGSALLYEEGFEKVDALCKEWLIRRLHARCPQGPNDKESKRIVGVKVPMLRKLMRKHKFNPWERRKRPRERR